MRVDCGNLQMSLDMPLHRIPILVRSPTCRAARSLERAPECRDTWDPLHNGVPGDMWGGRDNRWVREFHHHQVAAIVLTCEVGDGKSVECSLRSGNMPPSFCSVPIIEASVKWLEPMEMENNSQSSRHSS